MRDNVKNHHRVGALAGGLCDDDAMTAVHSEDVLMRLMEVDRFSVLRHPSAPCIKRALEHQTKN
jgi:hypothetical protein